MSDDGVGIGEAEYPPGFFGDDYVPDSPGETTQPSVTLPPDIPGDLAVTGVDPTAGLIIAWLLIPVGIAAMVGAHFKRKRAKA